METSAKSGGDELEWSGFLSDFRQEDSDNSPFLADYLFRTDRFSEEFWLIADEISQLNDYCVLCTQEANSRLLSIERELKDLQSGRKKMEVEGVDYTWETMAVLHDDAVTWRDTNSFLTIAMCLILLFALTERCLKLLCQRLAPEGANEPQKLKQESKIASYIRYLQCTCEIPFTVPPHFASVETSGRSARNKFAHGDWDELRGLIKATNLRQSFLGVSLLFGEIEIATWNTAWKKYVRD